MIKYMVPENWIKYDVQPVLLKLIEAISDIKALILVPYQRAWVEKLQYLELKREVAGTSRIEGAEFTEGELEEALREAPEQIITRSQKQAHAAAQTYRWIAGIPDDRPVDSELIKEIHRRIVTGADDDHCEPGRLRRADENVNLGQPRHRGAAGGAECESAFGAFAESIQTEYSSHNAILQALAAHYHLAAMHPFLDGNGRTARALEALLLQRAGLRDTCFIAMSNYYYEEKINYLKSLAEARAGDHDITPFILLGLCGIIQQVQRLLGEIRVQVQKAVYRNLMHELFGRLKTPRKRVMQERQLAILEELLEKGRLELVDLPEQVLSKYRELKLPFKAIIRDLDGLLNLKAIAIEKNDHGKLIISPRLEWPTEINESEFDKLLKNLPQAKTRLI